jgi:chromosome segregation ATPase
MKAIIQYAMKAFTYEPDIACCAQAIEQALADLKALKPNLETAAELDRERKMSTVLLEENERLRADCKFLRTQLEEAKCNELAEDNGRLSANLRRLQKELEQDRQCWNETTAQLEACRHDLGLAVKEASARDEKWKTGIEEVLGCKLDFETLNAHNCASAALVKWAADQRRRCDRLDEALLQIERMICAARVR